MTLALALFTWEAFPFKVELNKVRRFLIDDQVTCNIRQKAVPLIAGHIVPVRLGCL
jgi:hypothetical protein